MKLSEFKGLLKTAFVSVANVEHVIDDYYKVKFNLENGLDWQPGEHGIISFPDHPVEGRKWRAFSIASAPHEGFAMIGTYTGEEPSSYKKTLIALKPGDRVKIRGPFGGFLIQDETSPMVMVAGGIGITPVRAILKNIEGKNHRRIELLWPSNKYRLFEEDIRTITERDTNITLYLPQNRNETQSLLQSMMKELGGTAYYYISGGLKMVQETQKYLKQQGIDGKRILFDPFIGH
jgi:NAD(P)H-flavin reductase